MSSEVENGYTFRMGDHEITLRDSFASMLDSSQLTDCLLVAPSHLKDADGQPLTNGHSSPTPAQNRSNRSEQILRTHRVILSASSDYFRSIFAAVPNTLNNGVVAVVVPNVDFEDMAAIVDFIYKGQVSVGQSRIHKFLAAAQLLMVKGLMNIKLVTQDDQPIDDHSFSDNETIQRLKTEKRVLEEKIQSIKEKEWMKTERMKHEIENELKKKFEIERSILSDEKQRFEAEKMKFTIEKEIYEKNKANQSNNKPNSVIKPIIVNLGKSILGESLARSAEKDREKQNSIASTSETPKSAQTAAASAGTSTSTAKTIELKSTSSDTPNSEAEGRVLRKRIRLSDVSENSKPQPQQQSANKSQTIEEDEQMDVEDEEEDGEVYEVDFSQTDNIDESKNDQTEEVRGDSANKVHKSFQKTDTPTTTPSQISTRSLRRSTSSIGSASTQSVGGENGVEGDSRTSLRRKGPGRTPHWAKNGDNTESGGEGTPVTRNKIIQQKANSEEPPPPVGIKQSPNNMLYTCPYCPQVYHGNQSMQDHINGVHLNQKTQYICDHCGKVYTWRISLNKHLRTMHPDAPIPE